MMMKSMMKYYYVFLFLFSVSASAAEITVHLQKQVASAENPNVWQSAAETQLWQPTQTAIVICDMWDKHWCKNCTRRVAEMVPTLNQTVAAARKQGVLIVHAPSETMHAYEGMPQRKRVQEFLDKDKQIAGMIKGWQTVPLDTEKGKHYPIEVLNGGCDCPVPCKGLNDYRKANNNMLPWQSEIKTLMLEESDIVSDNGNEIGAYLKAGGYKNVIVCGVATNMCVMGRSFGLRAMKRMGFNAVLMRDMTDSMYNPNDAPYVSHCSGNRLMNNYIERYVCPTMQSTDFTAEPPFRFQEDR